MNPDRLFDHMEDLLIYARHLTRDPDQAEDLVQDVVLNVLSREPCLSNVENPRRYMATMLRNLFLDQARKQYHSCWHHILVIGVGDKPRSSQKSKCQKMLSLIPPIENVGR